ncbi:MAG TPA: thiamine pyrophosphate-binding protein, partial [Afifellaceae bacterium]|nr:thiamine pyrophosphate-binding protein [Afifellaceae bacterium]
MLVCLHEEHAVAIAQGYAKATGRPMAVALHSNVGLMHGAMAIFNAWCDRQPMIILGATGPVDAASRRPWIDWVHTSQDQGALIRNFVKWDDQPGSVAAISESMLRAFQQAATPPFGPVYVCLDAGLQEQPLADEPELPDPTRFAPAPPARPDAASVEKAARLLAAAERPVILFGRCRRNEDDWDRRVALAERLDARMLSDLKAGSMVPTDHRLHLGAPFNKMTGEARAALREADVILSLGWIDLGGALRQAFAGEPVAAKVVHAGQEHHLHNGWGKEHCGLPPVDLHLAGDPDAAVADLLAALPGGKRADGAADDKTPPPPQESACQPLNQRHVAGALKQATGDQPVTFACLARAWPADLWPHRHPLDYLGKDGGG